MKRLWWVTAVVFLLGIGVGKGIDGWQQQREPGLPVFVQNTDPTQPETEAAGQTQPEPTGEPESMLPCSLRYTTLVAQKLVSYEGPYLESGTEENVVDVAALLLTNTGTIGIEYTQIVVTQGSRELYFDATYIPPRSTMLLLEENRSDYLPDEVTSCRCRTVVPGTFDQEPRTISLREKDMCTLEVTNLTDQPLSCVRVFYKHHMGQDDLYLGGLTYSAVIQNLQPGETRVITPYRYASGYTKVVAVTVE